MIATSKIRPCSIVEASITDLQCMLADGSLTAVDLVAKLLHRISTFDCRGPRLNSVPILNPDVFAEAGASDARRARGQTLGPLDGIPYTVKDSYKVKGISVASGSPAFQNLIAHDDAFTIQKLREAGAVLIGKTNMPPMAAGGMQRGVYGRAESPYNLNYLPAAFASGSSNGSAVATTAGFATFGMAEETVSSGRSPASNNALVAYTPSRGAISIRGNWPLYPTCDVVVPHTRTMGDLLILLDVIAATDRVKEGDFWRQQPFVKLDDPWRSKFGSFRDSVATSSFQGVRIAVPELYIGGKQLDNLPKVHTHSDVIALYRRAKRDLEDLGANIVEIPSFPLIKHYEDPASTPPGGPRLPPHWHSMERSVLIAQAWEKFLHNNNDPNISSLADVDWQDIFPSVSHDDPQVWYSEPKNRILYELIGTMSRKAGSLWSTPGLAEAIKTLEEMRKVYLEEWLQKHGCDCLIFPAAGDVGSAQADIDHGAAEHAWKNGIKYSNGNRVLRHCGVPTVTVPMGIMESKGMPVGLTFAGKGGDDLQLLGWAALYDQTYQRRRLPKETPTTAHDLVSKSASLPMLYPRVPCERQLTPELVIEKCTSFSRWQKNLLYVQVEGYMTVKETTQFSEPTIDVYIDAAKVDERKISVRQLRGSMAGNAVIDFSCIASVVKPPSPSIRDQVISEVKIARDSTMVVIIARVGNEGQPAGFVKLL